MARSRYGIRRHQAPDGTVLDSKRELARYLQLQLLEKGKVIKDLEVHPRIAINIGGVAVKYSTHGGRGRRQMFYVGDFRYFDLERNEEVLEDVKMQSGHRTEVYRIKRALVEAMGITITEY